MAVSFTPRFHDCIEAIDATAWDRLAQTDNPFVRHGFLAALERHGCIRRDWGWQPHHLTLHDADSTLMAAAPLYLKHNSHGEYVFDGSWAEAWQQAGGRYYPKLLCAVPYSPVTGPRLLAGPGPQRAPREQALVTAIEEETRRLQLSSAHVDFLPCASGPAFGAAWLPRFDWQYHWRNRDYRDFADFLAALRHKKRKNIRAERLRVARSGLHCGMLAGDQLSATDWDAVHQLYLHTFASKGNHATLTLPLFQHLAASLGDNLQLALARRDGQIIAMALFVRGGDTLYGRYWGASEPIPDLHFELCYYLGIEHAIAQRLRRFEPGAQGLHKLARGFLPTRTCSRHYLVHPGFRAAVADALAAEAEYLDAWREQLRVHSPYARDVALLPDAD